MPEEAETSPSVGGRVHTLSPTLQRQNGGDSPIRELGEVFLLTGESMQMEAMGPRSSPWDVNVGGGNKWYPMLLQ